MDRVQELKDLRETLGTVKRQINKHQIFTKDLDAYERLKEACYYIVHAIDKIVLAIDSIEHSAEDTKNSDATKDTDDE